MVKVCSGDINLKTVQKQTLNH